MKCLLSLLILTSFSLSIFAQSNYYVSVSGNNDDEGSLEQPWLTVQFGLDQLEPGDILSILAGTYNEKVILDVSGSEGNPITIRNYESDVAILDGSGLTDQEAMIEIIDQSYIVIEGLTITNNEMNDAQGILIENECRDITIRNNKISNINFSTNASDEVNENRNSQPLIVYGTHPSNAITNLIIDNNEIFDSRTGYSEALAINGNVDGFEVTNNQVHDIANIGIDIIGHEGTSSDPQTDQARNGLVKGNTIYNCIAAYATSGGIYVDGGKNVLIENNISYHNGYGIEIGCENVGKTAENLTVRNNFFYDNEVTGIAVGGFEFPSGSGKVVGAIFTNNTLFKNNFLLDFTGELFLTYCENCSFENNIFYINDQNVFAFAELEQPGFQMDYNLIFAPDGSDEVEYDWNGEEYTGFSEFQSETGLDANSFFADPEFLNASLPDPDLHIGSGSPAIDAGNPSFTAVAGETDIDGGERVKTGRVDIGADEFGEDDGTVVTAVPESILQDRMMIFPNPTNGPLQLEISEDLLFTSMELVILNVTGEVVLVEPMTKNFMDLSNLPQGLYLLRVSIDKNRAAKIFKIIKQ